MQMTGVLPGPGKAGALLNTCAIQVPSPSDAPGNDLTKLKSLWFYSIKFQKLKVTEGRGGRLPHLSFSSFLPRPMGAPGFGPGWDLSAASYGEGCTGLKSGGEAGLREEAPFFHSPPPQL